MEFKDVLGITQNLVSRTKKLVDNYFLELRYIIQALVIIVKVLPVIPGTFKTAEFRGAVAPPEPLPLL